MDKKLKVPLMIVLSGYIFLLGFYLIWCSHFFYERQYTYDSLLLIAANVFFITTIYLFPFFLVLNIKSFQKVWTSFSIISIITLFALFLIPSVNNLIYNIAYYGSRFNLKGDKTIETIEKNEPKKEILEAYNIKINKQFEDPKKEIAPPKKHIKEIESRLSNSLAINDVANKPIMELQAKSESRRKENGRLKKKLKEKIGKVKYLEDEQKTKGGIASQSKSNKNFNKIKIDSKMLNTESDTKNQEIIFKVQIISSSTRLAKNSPQFKRFEGVWEYNDGNLYKYTIGNKKDLKSATALQSELRKRGFSGAFVVAFKNGKRITVNEARKLLNN